MTAIELLAKWGIRNDIIAQKIGISKQGFANKVKGRYLWRPEEVEAIGKVLNELSKDISKLK